MLAKLLLLICSQSFVPPVEIIFHVEYILTELRMLKQKDAENVESLYSTYLIVQ